MNPAFSVVFLTTLIGAGQGLFLALYGAELAARTTRPTAIKAARLAACTRTGRSMGRRSIAPGRAGGLAEGPAVAHLGRTWAATRTFPAITTVPAVKVAFSATGGDRFDLGPLGSEVEGLQLAEVDFIQPLLVGFVGGRSVVHEWAENGRGYPV